MATAKEKLELAEKRIQEQLERLNKAKNLKKKIESQVRATESKEKRTLENRKKYLLGAMYFNTMAKNPDSETQVMTALDSYLKLDKDRAVFGFPPLPKTKPVEPT